jgi:hypothetical protein
MSTSSVARVGHVLGACAGEVAPATYRLAQSLLLDDDVDGVEVGAVLAAGLLELPLSPDDAAGVAAVVDAVDDDPELVAAPEPRLSVL